MLFQIIGDRVAGWHTGVGWLRGRSLVPDRNLSLGAIDSVTFTISLTLDNSFSGDLSCDGKSILEFVFSDLESKCFTFPQLLSAVNI